jgi:hypothetical protein
LSVDGLTVVVVVRFGEAASRICSNDMPPSRYTPYLFTSTTPSSVLGLRQYALNCFDIYAGNLVVLQEEITYFNLCIVHF